MKMTMSTSSTMSSRVHRKVMRAPHKRSHHGKTPLPGNMMHLGKFGKLAHYAQAHTLRPPEPCGDSNDSGLGADHDQRLLHNSYEISQTLIDDGRSVEKLQRPNSDLALDPAHGLLGFRRGRRVALRALRCYEGIYPLRDMYSDSVHNILDGPVSAPTAYLQTTSASETKLSNLQCLHAEFTELSRGHFSELAGGVSLGGYLNFHERFLNPNSEMSTMFPTAQSGRASAAAAARPPLTSSGRSKLSGVGADASDGCADSARRLPKGRSRAPLSVS
ncbi:hypothetical protein EVAR_48944_1 [Eumeta japonica]|uniref:Uncharacterized protein n=1 Tax=Eumeta variegata TaxID=151549 RepID=A0A4C1Y8U8_EUMVA|nr:hypothetical protein EVAR_48944_1 [Eumeta japonica]